MGAGDLELEEPGSARTFDSAFGLTLGFFELIG